MNSNTTYRWTRDLHLYFGLFISPFVVLFSISVILLNHTWLPWGGRGKAEPATRTAQVAVDVREENLPLAKNIQRQIAIAGEIDFINRNDEDGRLAFPITAPGYRAEIAVDTRSGTATIEEYRTGVWDAMNYLHKMPGPHNVSVRGNWVFTRVWSWIADWTVYVLLFLTATGVYLWTALKTERWTGAAFLGAGLVSFVSLVVSLVG